MLNRGLQTTCVQIWLDDSHKPSKLYWILFTRWTYWLMLVVNGLFCSSKSSHLLQYMYIYIWKLTNSWNFDNSHQQIDSRTCACLQAIHLLNHFLFQKTQEYNVVGKISGTVCRNLFCRKYWELEKWYKSCCLLGERFEGNCSTDAWVGECPLNPLSTLFNSKLVKLITNRWVWERSLKGLWEPPTSVECNHGNPVSGSHQARHTEYSGRKLNT